jgi:5'-deoxynucleotidase
MKIDKIIRTSHVKRWQIVRTSRHQTLAEHGYLVTMIAIEIAKQLQITDCADRLMMWAMLHDIPEVVTGDLATPVKSKIKFDDTGIFDDYDKIKESVTGTIICHIVKLADLIEAMAFLKIEGSTKHSIEVFDGIERKFVDLIEVCINEYPEFNWKLLYNIKQEAINV